MSGPAGKFGAVPAPRLVPWVELLAPRSPVADTAADPVVPAPKVDNEVRFPARLPPAPAAPAGTGPAAPRAGVPAPATELSLTGQAIRALLLAPDAQDGAPVRGSVPLLPSAGTPSAAALATALAQVLPDTGLFYESHLVAFAAGTRSLALISREPQARLASMAAPADVDEPGAPPAAAGVSPSSAAPQPAAGLHGPAAPQGATPSTAAGPQPVPAVPEPAVPEPAVPEPGREPALPARPTSALLPRDEAGAEWPVADSARDLGRAATAGESASLVHAGAQAPWSGVIHPQAAPLVQQQLDLLATAVFRWSGEVLPGVPMDWSIHEEEGAQEGRDDSQAQVPARAWSTTVAFTLPRMGRLALRLSVADARVQAWLAADRPGALEELRADGADLSQRLAAAGLDLQALQFGQGVRS